VGGVTHNRMRDVLQMASNLVPSSGMGLQFKIGKTNLRIAAVRDRQRAAIQHPKAGLSGQDWDA